ncbi:hypothetical protein PAMA_017995 [Pampus argenteus]
MGAADVSRAEVGRKRGVGGADVSGAEDELHAKTQSHRCIRYSLEQEGGGKENRKNIKFEAVLTHSPAGHHHLNRLCLDRTLNNAEIQDNTQHEIVFRDYIMFVKVNETDLI